MAKNSRPSVLARCLPPSNLCEARQDKLFVARLIIGKAGPEFEPVFLMNSNFYQHSSQGLGSRLSGGAVHLSPIARHGMPEKSFTPGQTLAGEAAPAA